MEGDKIYNSIMRLCIERSQRRTEGQEYDTERTLKKRERTMEKRK